MIYKNRLYITLIGIAAMLTFLNISAARRTADPSLFDPLVDVCELIRKYYVTEINDEELAAGAINGMLHQLDPYSEFIPAGEVDDFQKQTSGSYEGIGTAIDVQNGYLTVISPFEDSPAYKAGVLGGDRILEVDGKSTKGWSATRAVKELAGPANSQVILRLLHTDGSEETLIITRQEIHVPTVRGWRRHPDTAGWDYLLDDDAGIGYIRISQFTADTADELDRAFGILKNQNPNALILDLRANPGGLMSTAVAVADRFLDEGVIVSTRGAHSTSQIQKAVPENTYPYLSLVVLIDQGSASASEIVAGALQDHSRAVIVGKRSWGKGSVQRPFVLSESGALLKLTTDYYYLPKGRCVHRLGDAEEWGVTPDIEESLDLDKLSELRRIMGQLAMQPHGESQTKGPAQPVIDSSQAEDDTAALTAAPKAEKQKLVQQLIALDAQLAQAVKQCRGLLRAQPALKALSETLSETEKSPEPAPAPQTPQDE